jgi:hypothetical protein
VAAVGANPGNAIVAGLMVVPAFAIDSGDALS